MNILLNINDVLKTYKTKPQNLLNYEKILPINKNSELALECSFLIGKIMGDGNLDPKFTLRFIGQEEDLKKLCDLIRIKIGIHSQRFSITKRVHKGVSYLLQINCAFLGRILYTLGAPIGNKTKNAFEIPSWILTNQETKKKFLQALLEDELTTIKIEKCNYSVKPRLKMAKKEKLIGNLRIFMQQVKEAIESFDVDCNHISQPIEGHKTWELYFHINRNKKNIMKFKENIGFRLNQDKIRKLESCYDQIKASIS